MQKIRKILVVMGGFAVLFSLALTTQTLAAGGIKDQSMLTSIAGASGVSTASSVEDLTGTIIKAVLSITGLIFLILLVYAGMLWMTARGDESKVEKSKDIIEAAMIGLAITVSAYAITVFVTGRFSAAPAGDPATTIFCAFKGPAPEQFGCVSKPVGTDCQVEAASFNFETGTEFKTEDECQASASTS